MKNAKVRPPRQATSAPARISQPTPAAEIAGTMQGAPQSMTTQLPQSYPAPMTQSDSGVSPLMQGSLPPMASGSDNYDRQFYGGAPLPKRRFLPVGLVP